LIRIITEKYQDGQLVERIIEERSVEQIYPGWPPPKFPNPLTPHISYKTADNTKEE